MSIPYPGSPLLDFLDMLTFVPFAYLNAFVFPDRINQFVAVVYFLLHLMQAKHAVSITAPQTRGSKLKYGYIDFREGRMMVVYTCIVIAFADVPLLVVTVEYARDTWWAASKTFLALAIVSLLVTTARTLRILRSTSGSSRSKSSHQAVEAEEEDF